ncbi:hypothetical protein [Noviherbaspirillum massiliense]|nr:hypothetical protein [Noviherbaspirillum massiliense]
MPTLIHGKPAPADFDSIRLPMRGFGLLSIDLADRSCQKSRMGRPFPH